MTDKAEAMRTAPEGCPTARDHLIALGFGLAALLLFLWRIGDPQKLEFDETHYVPASRILWALVGQPNPEHPPLGKLLIGLSMAIFGDDPTGWRIMSALFGAALVAAGVMAAFRLFRRRPTAIMTGLLLLMLQTLYIQARLAMLDIFMAGFLMLAFWTMSWAAGTGWRSRPLLALTGLFLGLAVAVKWTAVPLVLAALIAFAWLRRRSTDAKAVPLGEGLLWLGPFALLVYLLTFLPYMFLRDGTVSLVQIIPHQIDMYRLQSSPMAPHTYQSRWWQWVLDLRPIWYLYEPVDGVQRGVLFLGNPAIIWAGPFALAGCLWAGFRQGARAMLVLPLLWAAALAFFIIIPKPVQFAYHYLVPSLLLCVAIAACLDHYFWSKGNKAIPILAIGFVALIFLEFYPIISAAALNDPQDFNRWMWLNSWR